MNKLWIFGLLFLFMVSVVSATNIIVNGTLSYTNTGSDSTNTNWNGVGFVIDQPSNITWVDPFPQCGSMGVAIVNATNNITICKFQSGTATSCILPYVGKYIALGGNNGGTYTRCWGNASSDPYVTPYMNFTTGYYDLNLGTVNVGTSINFGTNNGPLTGATVTRNIMRIFLNITPSNAPQISGIVTANSIGLANVTLKLYDINITSLSAVVITNSTGGYAFTNLNNNTFYKVIAFYDNSTVNYGVVNTTFISQINNTLNIEFVPPITSASCVENHGRYYFRPNSCGVFP